MGRSNKYKYSFYLKHIINVTINDLIRKNIINRKHYKYLHKYMRQQHEYLFIDIDSTNIANFSSLVEFRYNKCKQLKITAFVDNNKIAHLIDVSKGSIHDIQIMKIIINSKLNDNITPLNIVGNR